ncbi:MAG TPA: DnaB-like helicase N-terminal domain-containing protein, partial [Candidatus Paceibacterota bacterium]|nr:DnaB-like helicase N-terminal domain-containing protein [Candidatus Paceibacterota bacterium]
MAVNKQPFTGTKLRIPPNDHEAEQALLGSIMISPKSLGEIADFLRPEDFYSLRHHKIYNAMLDLSDVGQPIDIVSVSSHLKDKGLAETTGGSSYIA